MSPQQSFQSFVNTPEPNEHTQKQFKTAARLIIILFIGIVIFAILGAFGVFHKNPYGPEIKITGFNKYYKDVPTDIRDSIFALLYSTADLNIANKEINLQKATASIIKNPSPTNVYNKATDSYTGKFNIDVPDIQQSFRIEFSWSKDKNNTNIVYGSNVSIVCLRNDESTYHSTDCLDNFTSLDIQKMYINNPILNKLPLNISYYMNNYSVYVNYVIGFVFNEDETDFTITITDNTGGNYNNALGEIRKLGYDPSNYKIEYINNVIEEEPAGRPAEEYLMPGN